MWDELGGALFDKLPRKVQIGCTVVFWSIVLVGLILILLGKI